MMEFNWVHTDYQGNITSEIIYKVLEDGDLSNTMQEFRRFLLAVGFHPESVNNYIEEE